MVSMDTHHPVSDGELISSSTNQGVFPVVLTEGLWLRVDLEVVFCTNVGLTK